MVLDRFGCCGLHRLKVAARPMVKQFAVDLDFV